MEPKIEETANRVLLKLSAVRKLRRTRSLADILNELVSCKFKANVVPLAYECRKSSKAHVKNDEATQTGLKSASPGLEDDAVAAAGISAWDRGAAKARSSSNEGYNQPHVDAQVSELKRRGAKEMGDRIVSNKIASASFETGATAEKTFVRKRKKAISHEKKEGQVRLSHCGDYSQSTAKDASDLVCEKKSIKTCACKERSTFSAIDEDRVDSTMSISSDDEVLSKVITAFLKASKLSSRAGKHDDHDKRRSISSCCACGKGMERIRSKRKASHDQTKGELEECFKSGGGTGGSEMFHFEGSGIMCKEYLDQAYTVNSSSLSFDDNHGASVYVKRARLTNEIADEGIHRKDLKDLKFWNHNDHHYDAPEQQKAGSAKVNNGKTCAEAYSSKPLQFVHGETVAKDTTGSMTLMVKTGFVAAFDLNKPASTSDCNESLSMSMESDGCRDEEVTKRASFIRTSQLLDLNDPAPDPLSEYCANDIMNGIGESNFEAGGGDAEGNCSRKTRTSCGEREASNFSIGASRLLSPREGHDRGLVKTQEISDLQKGGAERNSVGAPDGDIRNSNLVKCGECTRVNDMNLKETPVPIASGNGKGLGEVKDTHPSIWKNEIPIALHEVDNSKLSSNSEQKLQGHAGNSSAGRHEGRTVSEELKARPHLDLESIQEVLGRTQGFSKSSTSDDSEYLPISYMTRGQLKSRKLEKQELISPLQNLDVPSEHDGGRSHTDAYNSSERRAITYFPKDGGSKILSQLPTEGGMKSIDLHQKASIRRDEQLPSPRLTGSCMTKRRKGPKAAVNHKVQDKRPTSVEGLVYVRRKQPTETESIITCPSNSRRVGHGVKIQNEKRHSPGPKLPRVRVAISAKEVQDDWRKMTGQKYEGPKNGRKLPKDMQLCKTLVRPHMKKYFVDGAKSEGATR